MIRSSARRHGAGGWAFAGGRMGALEDRNFLEITTAGQCSVHCTTYCPWEVYRREFSAPARMMSVPEFSKILAGTPRDYVIAFAGFCEPLDNPDCLTMIEMAHDAGYELALLTTLSGFSGDIERIARIPFVDLCLHLPDCYGHARIKMGESYGAQIVRLMTTQRRLTFSIMNDAFTTNRREDIARGRPPRRFWLPRTCDAKRRNQFVVVPDGRVFYCCVDFALSHPIGNLYESSLADIAHGAMPPHELCASCGQAKFVLTYYGRKAWRAAR